MISSSGYSWTNTSQWSQLPTVPANGQNDINQQQQYSNNYSDPQSSYSTQTASMPSQSVPPETRRDMVTRLYRQILGREPDTTGLNYYLFNSNIPETQIAKEMYESTEHQEILTRSKDIREMITRLSESNKKASELENRLKNAESLNNNYQQLLDQKTETINQLMAGNYRPNIATDQEVQPSNPPYQQPDQQYQQMPQYNQAENNNDYQFVYPEGIMLNDPFEEKPSKKGIFNKIKGWFKF